jgi:hypothetical protein
MANTTKAPVAIQELLVSSLAQSDALAKLLIEKGVITQQEFLQKIAEERASYQKLLSVWRSNQEVFAGFILSRCVAQSL